MLGGYPPSATLKKLHVFSNPEAPRPILRGFGRVRPVCHVEAASCRFIRLATSVSCARAPKSNAGFQPTLHRQKLKPQSTPRKQRKGEQVGPVCNRPSVVSLTLFSLLLCDLCGSNPSFSSQI